MRLGPVLQLQIAIKQHSKFHVTLFGKLAQQVENLTSRYDRKLQIQILFWD